MKQQTKETYQRPLLRVIVLNTDEILATSLQPDCEDFIVGDDIDF